MTGRTAIALPALTLAAVLATGCLPKGAPPPPEGCWEPAGTVNVVNCNNGPSWIAAWSNYHIRWPQIQVVDVGPLAGR